MSPISKIPFLTVIDLSASQLLNLLFFPDFKTFYAEDEKSEAEVENEAVSFQLKHFQPQFLNF